MLNTSWMAQLGRQYASYDECMSEGGTGVIAYPSGRKVWMQDGLVHRDDGPAVEWEDGRKSHYRRGVVSDETV